MHHKIYFQEIINEVIKAFVLFWISFDLVCELVLKFFWITFFEVMANLFLSLFIASKSILNYTETKTDDYISCNTITMLKISKNKQSKKMTKNIIAEFKNYWKKNCYHDYMEENQVLTCLRSWE